MGIKLSNYLVKTGLADYLNQSYFVHWCPACMEMHGFAVEQPQPNGAQWAFDGNLDQPTFNPSMNISIGPWPDGRMERCHYFLHGGKLMFCEDSTHALAGQIVPLPEVPESVLKRMEMVEARWAGENRQPKISE